MGTTLSYIDDADRAYGATGMAIGIAVANAEEMAEGIDLDMEPADMMMMSDSFWFSGYRGDSVADIRKQLVGAYHVAMVMAIGNLLCRTIVGRRKIASAAQRKMLLQTVVAEALDSCGLDDDEITPYFDKDYNYMARVFSHSGVQDVVERMASELRERRRMSRLEMLECLRPLSML